jgi:Zn-dependent peptidase ImmA (M78 family)
MPEKLFLPFTPGGKAIETRAIDLKRAHGFGPYVALDPETLADAMDAHIVAKEWFASLPSALRNAVLIEHRDRWSAGSITVEGRLVILANPGHPETRRTVTLLEELVHHGLGHPKSELMERDGLVIRTCRHDIEDEAYAVATALVMPYRQLFAHVDAGRPLEELDTPAPVSQACRLFRVKRAGLWRVFQSRMRSA